MCRRKPGPRCPSCQHRALTSIQGRLERTVAAIQEAPEGPRQARLQAEARDLAREVACRRADLYATSAFQRESIAELEHLIDQNPKDPAAGELASQIVEGQIMNRYRREQHALMPPVPQSEHAQQHHHDLGSARFDMAHARLRMDMSSADQPEWQEWQQRHHHAAQRAALAQAHMEAVAQDGKGGWSSLTKDQQRSRRDAIAADPTLATPVAPRRWSDVVDETQDLIDGIHPVREALDDTGYPPYGNPEPRPLTTSLSERTGTPGAGSPAASASSAVTPDSANPPDPAAPVAPMPATDNPTSMDSASNSSDGTLTALSDPTPGYRQSYSRGSTRQLASQARRRKERRKGARTMWRSFQTDKRRMESSVQRAEQKLDDMTPSPQYDSSVFDLTLFSLITERIGGR